MEELYLILIETFSDQAKLKKYEKKIMVYGAVFDESPMNVKAWKEITPDVDFPNGFKPVGEDDIENIKAKYKEDITYNSTHTFNIMSIEQVTDLVKSIDEIS